MDHSWGYGTEQRQREENQDCHGVFEFPDFTLAVVCDGMGGHVGGAQASSLAVRAIHDAMRELRGRPSGKGPDARPLGPALEEAIQRTNLVIYETAQKNHRLMGMGTTVVAAAVSNGTCVVAHVGDSRAYLVRNGQVTQLTRDHTMVNLFVDADLLSPEDAATHPEAHVLSRSLGVDRQIDVDVSEPVPLVRNDVILLCSDGVHGVVTDWELANVDWSAPHEAVRHILGIVSNREGDDNATAVSVLMGTSIEDVPATPPPEPKQVDHVGPPSGVTAVPLDDDMATDVSGTRAMRESEVPHPAGGGGYIVYEPGTGSDAPPPREEVVISTGRPAPTARSAGRSAAAPPVVAPPVPATTRRRSPALPMAVATLALVLALGATTLLLLPDSSSRAIEEEIAIVVPGEVRNVTPVPGGGPAVAPSTPAANALGEPLFAPNLPAGPRRLPHGSGSHTQAPPGGTLQNEAMNAVKRKDCPRALLAIQRGMREVSPDHAVLYRSAWVCFTDAHQRPLMAAKAATFDDFQLLVPHFEGAPELRRNPTNPELSKVPIWARPALDGIEFRLEQWSDDPEMHEVVAGLFGEPQLADTVAIDLHLVGLAAEGLSRIPPLDRNPRIEEAWARRVYVLARALGGLPGRMLGQHRRDILEVVRGLQESATTPRDPGNGEPLWEVPVMVIEAREAGEGLRPVIPAPKPKPVNVRDLEPVLEAEDDPNVRVERSGARIDD